MSTSTALASAIAAVVIALHPAFAHDAQTGQNYEKYRQPNGASCCSGHDCRPVIYEARPNGVLMFPDGRLVVVPDDRINRMPSDDGLAHWCGVLRPNGEATTYCAILPIQAVDNGSSRRTASAPSVGPAISVPSTKAQSLVLHAIASLNALLHFPTTTFDAPLCINTPTGLARAQTEELADAPLDENDATFH